MRDSASVSPFPRPPSPFPEIPLPPSPVPEKGPLTVDRLRAVWPSIVAQARAASPMMGTLLADTEVRSVAADTVTLGSAGHGEGLTHKREAIARLLEAWVDGKVKIAIGDEGRGKGEGETPQPRPTRLTESSAKAERLKVLREKDPSLGNAVDALDLELIE